VAAGALAVVIVLAVGGCGGDDDDGADAADGGATTSATAAPGSGTTAATGTTLAPPVVEGTIDVDTLRELVGDAPAVGGPGLAELAGAPGEPGRTPLPGFGETAVAVTAPDGTVTGWCLLAALTEAQRQRGLMEVTDLGGFSGMVFGWSEDADAQFYMRNTPMPLSIAFVGADGSLVSNTDMAPCDDVEGCPLYSADGPYRFAVEVPQGALPSLGVEPGSTFAFGGSCV
jgi:uncharacterized membrane protein (UPF0127 family)